MSPTDDSARTIIERTCPMAARLLSIAKLEVLVTPCKQIMITPLFNFGIVSKGKLFWKRIRTTSVENNINRHLEVCIPNSTLFAFKNGKFLSQVMKCMVIIFVEYVCLSVCPLAKKIKYDKRT